MKRSVEIPVETAATLVMACAAIDDILTLGELTEDIVDELREIQPFLNNFANMS